MAPLKTFLVSFKNLRGMEVLKFDTLHGRFTYIPLNFQAYVLVHN